MSWLAWLCLLAVAAVLIWVADDLFDLCDVEPAAEEDLPRLDETLAYVAFEHAAEARLKGWRS